MSEPLACAILAALADVRLEAIWIGTPAAAFTADDAAPARVELLVRDTPLHRKKLQQLATRLRCTRVPLSNDARTLQLVGAARPIDIVFGRAGSASYASVRARAEAIAVGTLTALLAIRSHG